MSLSLCLKMLKFLVLRLCPRFSDMAISTHKNVEMSRAETILFPKYFFAIILQICKGSVTRGQTD